MNHVGDLVLTDRRFRLSTAAEASTGRGNMGEQRYKKFTILHSNDMHGDFLAEA